MSARSVTMTDELGRSITVVIGPGDGFTMVARNEFGDRVNGAYWARNHAHMLYLFLRDHVGEKQ